MALDLEIGYPINKANPLGLPLPTQERFHASRAKYRLLAGGFATGKTTSLCIETLAELCAFPYNYGVLGRKDLAELKSTTLKELLDICPDEIIKNHNKSDKFITFMNGSELYYMNLDDARAAEEKIKSLNLGFAAVDQLEEIGEIILLAFQGRLRRANTNRNFFATCNPAGHDWLWERWKNNPQPGYELFEAITLENIYLPKDYLQELLNYPKNWVKRFVYCSWDDFEGSVYSEFNEKLHVINSYQPSPFDQHYVILDYGYRNPTAILFAATNFDGETIIYDEYYQSGKLIPEICEILQHFPYWKKSTALIDPSTKNRQRDGKSIHDEFLDNGFYFEPAVNDVSQGIDKVNQFFKNNLLKITKNCVNTLSEMGKYKWKELKPGASREDMEEPVKRNDHTMDCMRYLVNKIAVPTDIKSKDPLWLKELMKKSMKSETKSYMCA